MSKLGLILNEAKTSLWNTLQERFDYLGYSFRPHYPYKSKVRICLGASPCQKNVQRLRTKVGELIVQSNTAPRPDGRDPLNRILRGWSTTSITARVLQPTAAPIIMSANACATTSRAGTRWQGVTIAGSLAMRSFVSTACCAWNDCPGRGLCGEVIRKAGCRSSARPV
jgi:hypothetical protein